MYTHKKDSDPDYTVKSVDKALEVLDILTESEEGTSLAQLASRVAMTRNGVFRILRTMTSRGLVEQDPRSGAYRLGLCSVPLAYKMLKVMNVASYAHPVLEDLARKHDEAVYLTVLKDDNVLFLDMVDCGQQIKTASLLGRIVPIFSNAAGKVMKSFESRDLLERLLKKKRKGLKELEMLDLELNEIRANGVAVDKGGLGEGIISVAVVVRDYTGKVVGAITLIGPSFRMLTDRLEKEIIPSLKEGADLLSGRFGYCPA